MKTYTKKIIPFFTFLICLLNFNLVHSSDVHKSTTINIDSVGNSTRQEIIDEFARVANEELNQIIAQNAINDLNGESQKNNYIFGFEQNRILLENKYLAQFKEPLLTNITILNNHLVSLNATLKTKGKPLIYIGIDATLGEILSKIKVSGIQTTAKLEQITIQKQEFDSFESINNTYKTIYDNVGNHLPDLDSSHPNGMIILGYGIFKKYSINGEVDPDKLSADDIKKVSSVQEWQFCNYKEKISTLGVGSTTFRALVFQDFSQFPKSTNPDDVQEHLQNFATQVYKSLTGDKVFISKGRLHKDFYAPNGDYRLKFDTDVTEEQVLKVNALIEEMMDDPLYANYIKPAITTKTQGGYKLKQADLVRMENALKDLKEAQKEVWGSTSVSFLKILFDYFEKCKTANVSCVSGSVNGYIPQCFWDVQNPQGFANEWALVCGIADGAIETAAGAIDGVKQAYKFGEFILCWQSTLQSFWFDDDCAKKRIETIKNFKILWEIVSDTDAIKASLVTVVDAVKQEAINWGIDVSTNTTCSYYKAGKLIFDIGSMFLGIGELKSVSKITKVSQKFSLKGFLGDFSANSKSIFKKFIPNNGLKMAQEGEELLLKTGDGIEDGLLKLSTEFKPGGRYRPFSNDRTRISPPSGQKANATLKTSKRVLQDASEVSGFQNAFRSAGSPTELSNVQNLVLRYEKEGSIIEEVIPAEKLRTKVFTVAQKKYVGVAVAGATEELDELVTVYDAVQIGTKIALGIGTVVKILSKDKDKDNPNCVVCENITDPVTKEIYKKICNEIYNKIPTETNIKYVTALNAICSSKGNLKLIELNSLGLHLKDDCSLETKKAFLNDCIIDNCGNSTGCSPIKNHLSTITADHVKNGWNVIKNIPETNNNYETPKDRQDYNMLVVLDEITKNKTKTDFLRKIKTSPRYFFDEFFTYHLKASSDYTSIGRNQSVYQRNFELYNLDNFLNKYTTKAGSDDYIKEMLITGNKFKGGSWGLSLLNMASPPSPFSNGNTQNIVEFEATIQEENDQVEDKDDHRLDIRINNSGNKNIELKNWATFKYISFYEIKNGVPTTKESGFKTQLFSYFKNASTMNDFVYIFKFRNGGITLNGAKSKFQTLFQTIIKDKNGNDVNALWYLLKDNSNDKIIGNITLLKRLFLDAGQDYDKSPLFTNEDSRKNFFINNIVNVANSSLYSFIKIQSDL